MNAIVALFTGIIGFIVLGVIAILIAALFMMFGAKLAGIRYATYGKSVLAAITSSVLTWVVSGLFSIFAHVGTILGFIIGLVVSVFVIKWVYKTSLGKSILAWIFYVVVQIVMVILLTLVFGFAFTSF